MDPSRAVMAESRGVAVLDIVQTINTGEKKEKCRPSILPEINNYYYYL